jgi:homoserine acetyltransferase
LGNGLSSSPSNTPPPYDRARFPNVTAYDNVRLQHRLMTEKFGVTKIKLGPGLNHSQKAYIAASATVDRKLAASLS